MSPNRYSNNIIEKIKYPLLIDGGLSNELEKQGCNLNDKLWSARMLEINPDAIIKAHHSYLSAGAQCITTASYQASIEGFMSLGYDYKQAEAFILMSVQLAEKAIDSFMTTKPGILRPIIAASIGPYGAYLADGSEYTGNYGISDTDLRKFHENRIGILDGSNADIFACETIPSFQEVKVLAEILRNTNKPAWVSFSCKDESHINDGTLIKECVAFLAQYSNIFAIGVNCTAPKYISGLIETIKSEIGTQKIIIYPNSGEAYNAKNKQWVGISDPNLFIKMAKEWLDLGADIIGGCCRIGTHHIYQMNKSINRS